MPKTKEQIAIYNKEYFSRPEVIARAKVRNAERREVRQAYKQTIIGRLAEKRYRQSSGAKERVECNRLKTRYNLTFVEVQNLKDKQSGLCAICKGVPKTWHIDHNHDNGVVRGLLCGPCNMALGLFKDNTAALLQAIEYLG